LKHHRSVSLKTRSGPHYQSYDFGTVGDSLYCLPTSFTYRLTFKYNVSLITNNIYSIHSKPYLM